MSEDQTLADHSTLAQIYAKVTFQLNREGARAAAELFRGTPHKNRIAIPGIGVDCICLAIEIYRGGGMLPGSFALPQYSPRHGVARERNVAAIVFQRCCHFADLGVPAILEFGDLLIFKVGQVSNHVGVMIDGYCIHSAAGRGVRRSIVTSGFRRRIERVLRPVAPGLKCDPSTIDCLEVWREVEA